MLILKECMLYLSYIVECLCGRVDQMFWTYLGKEGDGREGGGSKVLLKIVQSGKG